MSEDRYDIVFKGEIVKSVDVSTAKQNVGKLFKMQGAKLDALFSGKTIVLKKSLDFDTASKYRVTIKKAGALVDVVAQASANEKPQGAGTKAVFGERASASEPPPTSASPTSSPKVATASSPATATQAAAVASAGSGMTIAPAGSDLVEEKDRPHVEAVSVDVSGITLKENSGDLLDASEKRSYDSADIDVSSFDLAPAGADVLNENERKKVEVVNVDTSALDVAEVGERLSVPRPPAPPPPDVSKIKLAELIRNTGP